MEILSPAGSFKALAMAVSYGADAVYVGGSRFSARKNAQNFSDEELQEAVDYCHLRGVKLYLCCNTLIKETELDSVMEFVRYAYTIGVDALIVQDLGLIARVRRELPDFPLHASTQMTTVSSGGVNQLAQFGMKRVVLARELSKAQIAQIKQSTHAELEVFVHGALCISYSGQCLMSSFLGGRSGNRGACAQPCRLPYTLLKDGKPITEKATLLCPKDLCLAARVDELAALGVTSLKIEGRMKSPEYVAMVTRVYKNAVSGKASEEEIQDMLKFFSRGGSCSGYFDGARYAAMMDMGENSKIADSLPSLPEPAPKRKPISLSFFAEIDRPARLTAVTEEGAIYTAEGGLCERARTSPTPKERIKSQLEKLGETPFYARDIEVIMPPEGVIAIKEINGLRRQAAEGLLEALCNGFRRTLPPEKDFQRVSVLRAPVMELSAEVRTQEQLMAVAESGIRRVYMPPELWQYKSCVPEPVLQLPDLPKEGEQIIAEEIERVCLQNIGQLSACNAQEVTAGHRLNITNSETLALLSAWGVSRAVLSPELTIKAIAALRKHTDMPLEAIGYGRVPLMLLEHCVIKSAAGCSCENGSYALLDRKHEVFPIVPRRCGNVIYNAKPIFMADRLEELSFLGLTGLRLLFTVEDGARCKQVLAAYQQAIKGKTVTPPADGFTRGHFYRGMQ